MRSKCEISFRVDLMRKRFYLHTHIEIVDKNAARTM